ncbi:MAG: cytochrome c biogenesis protein ResB [Verrucomicrobiae bacterium]|nr:cytochrome c biogenesis protein ResB [Verrucomicrobiae bacterium]
MWIRRIPELLGSLRLTVICLGCAALIVFWGTLAQVDIGVYAAQERFFRSWFISVSLPGTSVRIPVFPGGYLVGAVLCLNIVFALVRRRKPTQQNLSLWATHVGLLMLMAGQFAGDMLSVESTMRLVEGHPAMYSEDQRHVELAVIETTSAERDRVAAIPTSLLVTGREIELPGFPFKVRVNRYMANSRPVDGGDGAPDLTAQLTTGEQVRFRSLPRERSGERRDMPTVFVELVDSGRSLGSYVASLWLTRPESVRVGDRTFELWLRPVRYYKPFALELLKFKHETYPGSSIPRNFESEVRLFNPHTGEDRTVRIRMNNPLRYQGETFYQSGYDDQDPRVSILQVVRNPAWLTPYVSCALVGLGLLHRFTFHLINFAKSLRK